MAGEGLIIWSIIDLQCYVAFCCTAKWFSYTYIYILFHIIFHCVFITGFWIQFPMLYSRPLLFIHPICTGLHLLIQNSHSIHSPALFPLGNHKSILWLWVCFKDKFVCVMFQVLRISDIIWYLSFSFWLSSLSMIISRSIHVAANGIISFFFMSE